MSKTLNRQWLSRKCVCLSLMIALILSIFLITLNLIQSVSEFSNSSTPIMPEYELPMKTSTTSKQHTLSALYDNPFKSAQCRNALSDQYGLDGFALLKRMEKCKQFGGVLTRENLKKIVENDRFCPFDQRSAIRSHQLKIDQIMNANEKKQKRQKMPEFVEHYPVYFMIAKAASSSIMDLLRAYNEKFGYLKDGDVVHKIVDGNVSSECSFTFVRDPITRFIAGYYTINALLYLQLKESFSNIQNSTFLMLALPFDKRKRHKNVRFATVNEEPKRFKVFVEEMIANPFRFTRLWSIDHIQSQTEILSVHLGKYWQKNFDFIGKVEQFQTHWRKLTNLCSAFFRQGNVSIDLPLRRRNDKFEWNMNPRAWRKEYHRFEQFIEYLGLQKV